MTGAVAIAATGTLATPSIALGTGAHKRWISSCGVRAVDVTLALVRCCNRPFSTSSRCFIYAGSCHLPLLGYWARRFNSALRPSLNCKKLTANRSISSYRNQSVQFHDGICRAARAGKLSVRIPGLQYGYQYGVRLIAMVPQSEINAAASNSTGVFRHNCRKVDDDDLQKAISYEAERGFKNSMGSATRFSDFLSMKLFSVLASTEGDKISLQVLADRAQAYERMNCADRLNLLDKVSQILGFHDVEDLVDHQTALKEASQDLHRTTEKSRTLASDILEQRKGNVAKAHSSALFQQASHPSVVYGSSEKIELYKFPETEMEYTNLGMSSTTEDRELCSSGRTVDFLDVTVKSTGTSNMCCETDEASFTQMQDPLVSELFSESMAGVCNMDDSAQRMRSIQTQDSLASEYSSTTMPNACDKGVSTYETPPTQTHNSLASDTSMQMPIECKKDASTKDKNSCQGQVERAAIEVGIVSSELRMIGADGCLSFEARQRRKDARDTKLSEVYDNWLLNKPISLVKSLSASQCLQLDKHGLHTLRKLLQHFPRTYINFRPAGKIVEDGQYLTFFGKVISSRGQHKGGTLGLLEVVVKSIVDQLGVSTDLNTLEEMWGSGVRDHVVYLHLKRFFRGARFARPWFLRKIAVSYPVGSYAAVSGKVKAMEENNHFEVREFSLELCEEKDWKDEEVKKDRPYPIYPSKAGLDPKIIEICIQKALLDLPSGIDPLPEQIRIKFDLMELSEAFLGMHGPPNLEVAEKARKRFVFDEFFYLQLGFLMQRQQLRDKYLEASGVVGVAVQQEVGSTDMDKWSTLTLKLLHSLPYTLTSSQIRVTSEIIWDLRRPIPMSRLLQGDVGCGKTIVAFLALLEVVDAGYQGALMVPTEFLANQHYQHLVSCLANIEEKHRPRAALLTSSVSASKARSIRRDLETGEIALAVGTHSLISDNVRFAALGLAIIDEQHRFGVNQRLRLNNKGVTMNINGSSDQNKGNTKYEPNKPEKETTRLWNMRLPHVLAMSATPIPRSLALALHGDMDCSQITELPPGRTPTKTYVIKSNKLGLTKTYEMIRNELRNGGRVYIVYPIIEESESLPNMKAATIEYDNIIKEFEGYRCGLVHGRLKAHEKEEAMRCFRSGETQVLVSTTVIELGVDIPEASMMVVINAEKYGLAQLHQLRGRVGRGSRESTCVFLGSSDESLRRIKVLEASTDGFYIAEMDLQLRGPGDLLGRQQSGHLPAFSIARLEDDGPIMNQARMAAEEILQSHWALNGVPKLKQELIFRRPSGTFTI